jgi:hypothetical protein
MTSPFSLPLKLECEILEDIERQFLCLQHIVIFSTHFYLTWYSKSVGEQPSQRKEIMDIDFDHLSSEISEAVDTHHKLSEDINQTLGHLDYSELVDNILFEFIYDTEILNRIRKAYEKTVVDIYSA